ncbi:hypothetical protein GCM10023189_39100 [Nibrella saemangeumensis]|uniref:Response regulator receiver domain-containing protein n=1 Tax=Nibrella saemangeumensis TaxID=1084526 RepID=A0ABP8N714_9BACT
MSQVKIRLLLVDDKSNFREAFVRKFDGEEFEVYTEPHLVGALDKLRADFFGYDFVIFDGLGHTKPGLTEDRGEKEFAYKAINELQALTMQYKRELPCCVFTMYQTEDMIQMLDKVYPDIPVFAKDDAGEELMLNYVREQYARQAEATFRLRHPEIGVIFQNGWLQREHEQELIKLFEKVDSGEVMLLKNAASCIRPIMEGVYTKLAELDRRLVPEGLQHDNQQSLGQAIYHIAGQPKWDNNTRKYSFKSNPFMPLHLWLTVNALQNATSTVSMHAYTHPISRYTLSSYANILADLLLWFSDFMQKRPQ